MSIDLKSADLTKALAGLQDAEGNALAVTRTAAVPSDRQQIYVAGLPDKDLTNAVLISCLADNEYGDHVDWIVKVEGKGTDTKVENVISECKIMYEELSPTQLVEYQFDPEGPWALCPVSLGALQSYKGAKYKMWKDMITSPTCQAQFRRMINIGLINRMYDDNVFPTPEADLPKYEVVDDHGKKVRIPHPVHALRIWNAETAVYDDVSPDLDGAPITKEDVAQTWAEMVDGFKQKYGEEFIQELLKSK